MTTIRNRLATRDRELFVARLDELRFFEELLAGNRPERVVHLFGPGGIGKSALMREVVRASPGGRRRNDLDRRARRRTVPR
ncbi:MAG: hypothetical protein WKF60_13315 [Ilumatobacter sp.]